MYSRSGNFRVPIFYAVRIIHVFNFRRMVMWRILNAYVEKICAFNFRRQCNRQSF